MFDVYISMADPCANGHDWSEWMGLATIVVRVCVRCDELQEDMLSPFVYGFYVA